MVCDQNKKEDNVGLHFLASKYSESKLKAAEAKKKKKQKEMIQRSYIPVRGFIVASGVTQYGRYGHSHEKRLFFCNVGAG